MRKLPFAHLVMTLAICDAFMVPTRVLSENPADEHVKLELISEQDGIASGKEFQMGIRFDLEEGWHTYWINPGDSGGAPRVEWALPAGFQTGPIQWPYPERILTPPFADYGYKHQLLLIAALRPPPEAGEGTREEIAVRIHYLVCRDVCIPGQKQLHLILPVKSQATASSNAQLFDLTRKRLPQPLPGTWKISAVSVGDEFVLSLRSGKSVRSAQFFPLNAEQIENAALQTATGIPGGIRLHLKKSNHLLKPISRLEGVVVLGSCRAYLVNVPVLQSFKRPQTSPKD